MHFLRRFSRVQVAAGAAAALVVVGLVAWLVFGGAAPEPTPTPSPRRAPRRPPPSPSPASPSPTATPEVATCPLNGLPLDDPLVLDEVAIAVQIENHPLARPARNLSNADMVIEAPVEGDTTRFTGIFLCRPRSG